VVVAGFLFGDIFSNTIKITKGVVSANRGLGDDTQHVRSFLLLFNRGIAVALSMMKTGT
jgi:hypothetical protein